MGMNDRDLMVRVAYDEYYRTHPRDRQRSHWVMTQDMHDWIRDLCGVPPPDDDPDDDTPRTECSYLFGLPVEIRDGVEGIRLEYPKPSEALLRLRREAAEFARLLPELDDEDDG